MADGKRNIEKQVEDAFIAALQANTDFGSTVIRAWKDGANEKDYPIVVIHCESAVNDPIDPTGVAGYFKCSVDIAAITYNAEDRDKAIVQNLTAVIRDTLIDSEILANLIEASESLHFYAVMNQSQTSSFDDPNVNIMNLAYDVRVQYSPA